MRTLPERLRDCIPLLDYGLVTMLELFEVEETTSVPSAAVPIGGSPRLLLNPHFIAESCPADEDLAVLLLHELHHLLLGHTRLFLRVSPAANLAFDAVINAMLSRRRPEPAWTALFRRSYPADVFPQLLLRPPEGFPGPPVFAPSVDDESRRLIHELYYSDAGTFQGVFDALVAAGVVGELPLLLGSHGDRDVGLSASDDPALFEAVRRVVERWPQPEDPRIGRSLEPARGLMQLDVPKRCAAAELRRALLAVARAGPRGRQGGASVPVRVESAWPSADRRAFAVAASGRQPLLYRRELVNPRATSGIAPIDVYFDVSGSMAAWLAPLVAALRSCKAILEPRLFTFDVQVREVPLDQVLAGRVHFGGGTDGSAFTAHLAARRSTAAVVLTDGYLGDIPTEHFPACRRAGLRAMITPGGWTHDLAPAGVVFHHLPRVAP
jgi:hypothetical protein